MPALIPETGNTVLHPLCQHAQSPKLIRVLVKAGAEPLTVDFAGNTLLHYVARQPLDYLSKEQMELLELMLALGIDASVRNNLGQIPFHIAVGMRDQNSWYTNGRLEFLLGSNGNPDVNVADNKEIRPIHLAATLSEHRVR